MTPTTLAETILRDVPRYRLTGYDAGTQPDGAGPYVSHHEVLAALTAALSPAPDAREAEVYSEAAPVNWDALLAAKGGDAHERSSRDGASATSPGVTAGAEAAKAREAVLEEAELTVPDEIELYRIIKRSGAKKRIDIARAVSAHLEPMRRAFAALIGEAALHPDAMLPEAIRLIRQEATRDHSQEVVMGLKHIALLLEQLVTEART